MRAQAPESLFDRLFTSASDVWSFGVLLWELATMGGMPYPALQNSEVYEALKTGYRMPCPEGCPPELHNLMLRTWLFQPDVGSH